MLFNLTQESPQKYLLCVTVDMKISLTEHVVDISAKATKKLFTPANFLLN